MAKIALLIGVSEYQAGLTPLPSAVKDIEAMQRILRHPETGGFDQVKILSDPDSSLMQQEIEALFSDRSKDDLVLLFFSGHGIKDDSGRLYFASRITRKTPKGELVRSTAVPANFVHDIMGNSRSKRQVVILDCCFSGAFAQDMTAKDDGSVDVQPQLGGEGRAVLTSSTSTQYSFEQKGSDLSIYTQYLVEGIETGAADLDNDGAIAVDELHDYAKQKIKEVAPSMKPEIYAVREGFRIRLASAPVKDPQLRYRKQVEQVTSDGRILPSDRRLLNDLKKELGLSPAEASAIEVETLQAQWDYQENLEQYGQLFQQSLQQENPIPPLARRKLKLSQERWNLSLDDTERLELRITQQVAASQPQDSAVGAAKAIATEAIAPSFPPETQTTSPVAPAPVGLLSITDATKFKTSTASPTRSFLITMALLSVVGFGFWGILQKMLHPASDSVVSSPPTPSASPTPSISPTPFSFENCIVVVYPKGINIRAASNGQVIGGLSYGDKATTTGEQQADYIEITAPQAGWIYAEFTQPCPADGSIPAPIPAPIPTPIPTPIPAPIPTPSPQTSKPPTSSNYSVAIIYRADKEVLAKELEQAFAAAGYQASSIESDYKELPSQEMREPGMATLEYTERTKDTLQNVQGILGQFVPSQAQKVESKSRLRRGDIQIRLF